MVDKDNSSISDHSAKPPRKLLVSKRTFILGLVILVLIGLGTFYVFRKHGNQPPRTSGQRGARAAPVLVPLDQVPQPMTEYGKVIASADKMIVAGEHDSVIQLLEPYEPKVTEASQKYAVDIRVGNAYFSKKAYKQAVVWLERAIDTKQPGSDSAYLSIAVAAENLGDKQKAIDAYRKVVELLIKYPNPGSEASVEKYQNKIKSLGGKV